MGWVLQALTLVASVGALIFSVKGYLVLRSFTGKDTPVQIRRLGGTYDVRLKAEYERRGMKWEGD